MRRLVAWISGAAGGIAAYRLLTHRAAPAPELPPVGADPRAEELRAKLDRQAEPEPEHAASAEPEPSDPDSRRARVHDEARAAVEQMRRTPRP